MDTTVNSFARFVADTRFEGLPADVVDETRRLLLDSVGCALAGVASDKGRWALEYARAFHAGPAHATAIGSGDRLSVPGAAFVNAEAINGYDHDAGMTPGHVSPFVIPPILAGAEQKRLGGRDLIVAVAIAHELGNRIGANLGTFRDIVDGRVSFPLVSGYSFSVFGGTAGIASLEGFPTETVASALGLAGHMAPVQAHTTMMKNLPTTTAKYLMAGLVAQTAVSAAYLARAGHIGDVHILDGDWGYWKFAGAARWDAEAALAGLGSEWRFQKTARYKVYPSCRIMHGALDCLIAIIAENGLQPGDIDHVHAYLEASCTEPVFSTRPIRSQVEAQFSVAHNIAMVCFGIEPGPRWQDWATINDPAVRRFTEKISFSPHPDYVAALKKDAQARVTRVEVTAGDRRFAKETSVAKGQRSADPAIYMSDDELAAKFRANAATVLRPDVAHALAERLSRLDEETDVAELLALTSPAV